MACPRLRMFAGPNGSGKSTLARRVQVALGDHAFGAWVNADEIERALGQAEGWSLNEYGVGEADEFARAVTQSARVGRQVGSGASTCLWVQNSRLRVEAGPTASYVAASVADELRSRLARKRARFSFETVMSHESKVGFFCSARDAGYRTYLYFVATEDVEINVRRVAARVASDGHDVSADKVRERYGRSLALLRDAVACSDRAYLFDNSGDELRLVAEYDGFDRQWTAHVDVLPVWVERFTREESPAG